MIVPASAIGIGCSMWSRMALHERETSGSTIFSYMGLQHTRAKMNALLAPLTGGTLGYLNVITRMLKTANPVLFLIASILSS